ncbi:MAG: YebC/PmpR family DNA-binding transcriptional regulator, partial [Planctomycetales bacterium]|nr:YebC/PmpR family DNA-binding transcriptional regulator [Planctomycetales bacterium]
MAGHSHSANIKHRKAAVDAKRGKIWTKCSKAIIVAAKLGGGDADTNPRLRLAVADAKAARMPKDTIERAIKKGTGELGADTLEEIIYEGYGPGGVAVMCDILTDNRNRTAPEMRKLFEIHGGNLGSTNCVAYMFERKGLFYVPADKIGEDELMELALEAGAEDVTRDGDAFEILCGPEAYSDVSAKLEEAGIEPDSQQLTRISQHEVESEDAELAAKVLKFLEAVDDHDDVQSVS